MVSTRSHSGTWLIPCSATCDRYIVIPCTISASSNLTHSLSSTSL